MKLAFIAAAVLLTTAAPAIAENKKVTAADIGREACRIHENGIPLPRAMQIAARSNMGATLRLSMATTTDEFVKIVHGETARACAGAWNKHVKKIQHQERMAAQKACANKLASVPTADRLKVLMGGC